MASNLLRSRKLARERKQRQRDRAKAAGIFALQCNVPASLIKPAKLAAMFHPKRTVDAVVQDALEGYFERTGDGRGKILEVAKRYWPKIRPYLPVATKLTQPGHSIRYGGNLFTFEEWVKLQPIDASLRAELARYGIKSYAAFLDEVVSIAG